MIIEKKDFKDNYLNVSENFKIKNENAIYLGPNGIGKTTTYNIIKSKFPSYGYFSYDDCKEKITKEKKKIRIDIRTIDIETLKQNKTDTLNEIDIKNNGFKKNNITSATKASEYSDYCKDSYNDNELAVLNFSEKKLEILLNYPNSPKKEFILQNIEDISNLSLTGKELDDIKEKYILESLDLLTKALDESDTKCPVCGYNHNKSMLIILKEKAEEYHDRLDKLINKYRTITKKTKYEIDEDIKEILELVKNNELNKQDVVNYIIIGNNIENRTKILEAQKKIKTINNEIQQLEKEREDFFNNLLTNWSIIQNILKNVFKEDGITFSINEQEKSITINLRREASTYSTGELNYIVFLINILEFEYSNRKNIIIDDPLSSFDIKKQYEIVFDIIFRLVQKDKKVLIFTHNINLINITNSQYPSKFNYYFIDLINNEVNLYNINMKTNGSILNIDELLKNLPDTSLEKKWIELLIKKDTIWEETSKKHKLFHYDNEYTESESGLSNKDLITLIDNFTCIPMDSFEVVSAKKILYLAAMRVWIEKKLSDNYDGTLHGNQLFPKINDYFKHQENWIKNLEIKKEDLTSKKVLLNQNDHYKSQIIPFHYALSISTDELVKDINDLKKILNKN